jgi:BlaI family transcriptional regulator, penicillinase repressor
MKKPIVPKPTDAEMTILRVLWRRGACTVREVWEQLNPEQGTGYTTVLKIMQIMFEKGFLERDERNRSHVYQARVSEAQAQRQAVAHLVDRVFAGSTSKLVMQALSVKRASPEERAEIRKLLDEMEGGRQ